jgi:SNF2 family DNA or RNA helicase
VYSENVLPTGKVNQPLDIESLARWGKAREVRTKYGPRLVRSAAIGDEFFQIWNERKEELKAFGLSVSPRYDDPSKWQVSHWQKLPSEVIQERETRVQMSKQAAVDLEIPKPDGLEFDYYPFQKAGINYLLRVLQSTGGLLADEMGTGKTIQSIGVLNSIPGINRVLVVCPLTLKRNWEAELNRWMVKKRSIGHVTANEWPDSDIVLIHYNILHKWADKLHSQEWDLLIADECHRAKSMKARQTRCLLGYKPTRRELASGMEPIPGIPAKRKLFLSGTPFENKPAELWPIINYIAPNLFSSKSAFERRYCGATNDGWGYKADGATNLEELGEVLRGCCMIRRTKREVLKELPSKTRKVVEVDSDGLERFVRNEQQVWHKHEQDLEAAQVAMELAKANDSDEEFKESVKALREKTKLVFAEMAQVRHDTAVAKLPKMVAMLREELEQVGKVIVFAHHKDVLTGLVEAFPGECVLLTGDTKEAERQANVHRFQNDSSCRVFGGAIRAAGEGITLTASSTVIFFENDWTASKMAQCSDRAHRIGQKDNVLVKYYILPGTIDAHMISTWIQKEETFEQAMDGNRPEIEQEAVLVPKAKPLATRREVEAEATAITSEQRWAILAALRVLSGMCDGARAIDGHGFNKVDAAIGHSLAGQGSLTPRQAALGQRLIGRYRRQLGDDTLRLCGIK